MTAERRCLPVGSNCPGTARREAACGEQYCPGETCVTFNCLPSGLQVGAMAVVDLLFFHLWDARLSLQVRDQSLCRSISFHTIGRGQWRSRQPMVEDSVSRGTGWKMSAAGGSTSVQVRKSQAYSPSGRRLGQLGILELFWLLLKNLWRW